MMRIPAGRTSAVCAGFVLAGALAACSAPVLIAPSAGRGAFRPAKGVPAVECSRAQSAACASSESACEEACSGGDAASCLALARRISRTKERDVDAAGRARSVELVRLACTLGLAEACHALVEEQDRSLSPADRSAAQAALDRACQRDPVCGCAQLGDALLRDPSGDQRMRGLAIVEAACGRGSNDACDVAELERAICAEQVSPRDRLCAHLEREGRIPPPPPPPPLPPPPLVWSAASLPAAAIGCFRVRVLRAEGDTDACRRDQIDSFGNPELAACETPPEPPDAVCIARDRYFTQAPTGAWDGWKSRWSTANAGLVLRNDENDTPLAALRLPAAGAPGATLQGASVELRRFEPAAEQEALASIARLPSIEAAYQAASRCVNAYLYGYDGPPAVGLNGSLALLRSMRAEIARGGARERATPERDCREPTAAGVVGSP